MPRAQKKLADWFVWEADPLKPRVKFSLLTDQDEVHIQEKASSSREFFDPETMQVKKEIVINRRKDRQETALAVTQDWESDKFFDEDDNPMKCKPKNIRFWACNNGFMVFLRECQVKLRKMEAEQREEAEKNS